MQRRAATARTKRTHELRMTLVVLVGFVLSACATTPAPVAEVPPPEVVKAPEPAPPAPVVVEIPKPVVVELFPDAAGAELEPLPPPVGDLWERIVAGYAIPDLENDPLVEKWEQWYSSRPEYMARMIERSRRYLYHIVTEVSDRKMPTEVALLPMIESAFNPTAMSTSKAAGIWQFIPSTGKHYGLAQNFWVDSRRDVIAATDKALDYLVKLHGDFDDWQLALAAYNWGEGNVGKAIARNKSKRLPTDYSSLSMPAETRNYLPKLQAVKNIVRDPEKYGLALADIPDAPFFAVVKTTRKMDTKRAAELAELSLEDFLALNPQHNRPVIAGADEYSILLPIDNAELFAAKLELIDQPLVSWQAYRVKAGETLPQIAAKYAMSVETLKAVNGIGPRARIHEGHSLLVPAQRPTLESVESLQLAVFTAVPSGRTFYYAAVRGDTLTRIAARYDVTVQELKSWNSLSRDTLAVGQKLRVTSDVAPQVAKKGGTGKHVAATRGAGKRAKVAAKPVATKTTAKTTSKSTAKTTSKGSAKPPVRMSGQFRGS